jgi:arylsulfatase A-like enzyme/Flp pilus assembly protein TadD
MEQGVFALGARGAVFLAGGCLAVGCASRPPDVVLITLDTTRQDVIGLYGGAAMTPSLDELGHQGAWFTRAYTVTPLTIPAHSSIMTGAWPPRHGVRDNGDFFLAPAVTTLAERLEGAGYDTMASVGAEVTSHHWGFDQGFDAFFDDFGKADGDGNRWKVERRGDAVLADALGWIRAHDGGRPMFTWLHFFDAHHPYEPPEPYADLAAGRPYLGEVGYVDSLLGELLITLRARDDLRNTLVVVLADHGEGLGSHGEGMHGVLLYDATTRIPLVVRMPGGGGGREIDAPASAVDVVPTVLAAAGIPVPPGLDGIDLGPLIRGEPVPARSVYAESLYARYHYGWAEQRALVTPTWKLIDSTTPELYGSDDRGEVHDKATAEAAVLDRLRRELGDLAAGMTPMAGAGQEATLDPERTAQLEALGYLSTDAAPATSGPLPDPVRQLPVLRGLDGARQAVQRQDFVAAKTQLEQVIAASPGLHEPRVLLATTLERLGETDRALDLLREIDAGSPASGVKATLGSMLLRRGDAAGGMDTLRQAIAIDPDLVGAWQAYLRALWVHQDPLLGAEAARAGKLLPTATALFTLRALAAVAQRQWVVAEGLLLEAEATRTVEPGLYHGLGMVRKARQDLVGAETYFQREIDAFPPAPWTRRVLVEVFVAQKRYDEQIAQLRALVDAGFVDPETLHSLGQALYNLKRFEEAAPVVARCRDLAPTYPGCAMLEANVLQRQGRPDEAKAAYLRAMALAGRDVPPEKDAEAGD